MKEMWFISATFCLMWFCANYFYNLSLKLTDISSNTILSNTSILFVLLLSFCLLKDEKFNWIKILGVFVSFAGATTIVIVDGGIHSFDLNHLLGNAFALISAVSYGFYATFLKK